MARKQSKKQIERAIKKLRPVLQKAFLLAIQNAKDLTSYKALIAAIESGSVDEVLKVLNLNNHIQGPLHTAFRDVYSEGGSFFGGTLPKKNPATGQRVIYNFNGENPRANEAIARMGGALIAEVTTSQISVIRGVLTESLAKGQSPTKTALELVGRVNKRTGKRVGGLLGLTEQELGWVAGRRAKLELEGRDPAQINRMVTKYENQLLKKRGERIARTEATGAFNGGRLEGAKQLVDSGQARQDQVVKVWHDAGDSRTRDTHNQMDGRRVYLDKPFISPSGAQLMYPCDRSLGAPAAEVVNCRCYMEIVVDWLADFIKEK